MSPNFCIRLIWLKNIFLYLETCSIISLLLLYFDLKKEKCHLCKKRFVFLSEVKGENKTKIISKYLFYCK